MVKVLERVLALSVLAMIGWAFLWPFLVSPAPANVMVRFGSIGTLWVFLGSVVALLVVRVRVRNKAGDG